MLFLIINTKEDMTYLYINPWLQYGLQN